MKRIVSICCALLIPPLTGCVSESADGNQTVFKVDRNAKKPDRGSRYGFGSDAERNERTAAQTRPNEDPNSPSVEGSPTIITDGSGTEILEGPDPLTGGDPTPELGSDPTTETPKPGPSEPPFASPVPGQHGLVYSPFAPGKEVSVKGYPPGTLVKCPYTDKEFKVP